MDNVHRMPSIASTSGSVQKWIEGLPNDYPYSLDERPLKRRRSPQIPFSPKKRLALGQINLNTMELGQRKRRMSPRKMVTEPGTQSVFDPDATPKSNRIGNWQDLEHSTSTSSRSSEVSKSRSSSPSKRKRNPVLTRHPMESVRLGDPTRPHPENMSSILDDIREISDGEQIISQSVAELLKEDAHTHRIKPRNIENPPQFRGDDLSDVQFLDKILEIQSATFSCLNELDSEASWNDEVHSTLLNLALRGHWRSEGIWYKNVTSVRIDDRAFLESMASRMVDYCITFGNSQLYKKLIIDFLKYTNLESINHAFAPSINLTPIAVSIETKRGKIDEDEAMHQLATWVAAQFTLLRRLVEPETALPPLILIMVLGQEWNMMIATSEGTPDTAGVIYREVHMGETTTILGICKVVKSLRRIAKYVDEVYKPWFEAKVLNR